MKEKNTWKILFIIISMTFMGTLDSSIVNTTLPVMSESLNVPLSSIEWVITSYIIIICSTLLVFGRLGDIIGKSQVFKYGTFLFTLGSFLCGISHSLGFLIFSRFIQGLGASAYMANNHGLITEMIPKKNLGKALGILTTAVALGAMIGPPIGGIIVSILNWNYIFLVNVPIGILIFIMINKNLPQSNKKKIDFDIKGSIFQFIGISLFFGSVILAQASGLKIGLRFSIFISVLFLILFIYVEFNISNPLLDLTILKNTLFSFNLICALISFICIAASTILLPFYFQYTLKLSPATTGFIVIISPIILAIFSPISGIFSDKIGPEKLCILGLTIMAIGFWNLSTLTENSLVIIAMVYMGIMSFGQALFQPANNTLIMTNCSPHQLGIAGSINSLTRNIGQIAGISLSTTILYFFMSKKLNYRVSGYVTGNDSAFIYGMKNDYKVLVVLCIFAILLNLFLIFKKRKFK